MSEKKTGIPAKKFHHNQRRKVISAAEVQLLQLQVITSEGEECNILVYRCGENVFTSRTLDGLFDENRRKVAADWIVQGLDALPADRVFDPLGNARGRPVRSPSREADTDLPAPVPAPKQARPADLDDDSPSFKGA